MRKMILVIVSVAAIAGRELLSLLESDRLAKAISRLKDRDREILFARVLRWRRRMESIWEDRG